MQPFSHCRIFFWNEEVTQTSANDPEILTSLAHLIFHTKKAAVYETTMMAVYASIFKTYS